MAKISSKITYNMLTGGINNVDSIENINATPKHTETPDMVNIEYFQLGGIKTMEGNTQIGTDQLSPVVGGWEYDKNNKKYMMIALKNGEIKVYNTVTEDFDSVYKFPHESDRVSFCNMNNGTVVTNGIDDLVFYEKDRNISLLGAVDVEQGNNVIKASSGAPANFGKDISVGDYINIENTEGSYRVDKIELDKSPKQITLNKPINRTYGVKFYGWKGLSTSKELDYESSTITVTESNKDFATQAGTKEYNFSRTGSDVTNAGSKSYSYNYYILKGWLYKGLTKASRECGWTQFDIGSDCIWAIKDRTLYFSNLPSAGSSAHSFVSTTFTNVSYVSAPYRRQTFSDYTDYCGYMVNDNKLYRIFNGAYTQLFDQNSNPIEGEFTPPSYSGSRAWKYYIFDGKLYYITPTSATRVGSLTNWTKCTSDQTSSSEYAYGIAGGQLYRLNGATATRINTATTWEDIYGYTNQSHSTYGIRNGVLCSIGFDGTIDETKYNNVLKFAKCDDVIINKDGSAISVNSSFRSDIEDIGDGWEEIYGFLANYPKSANEAGLCYGIKNNKLYQLKPYQINSLRYSLVVSELSPAENNSSVVPAWQIRLDSAPLNKEVDLNNYGIQVQGTPQYSDTISLKLNTVDVNLYTKTLASEGVKVYSQANSSSEIGDAIGITLVDNSLKFYTPTSNNSCTRNSSLDIINTEEMGSDVNLKMNLTEVSECNAYLVNEDDKDLRTPIRGKAINFYNGRLWVGTDNGLFYSEIGKYNGWDIKYDAGVLYSVYNDTSEISALGLYSEYLMVHKEFSTYILTCNGHSETINIRPYSNVTCNSQQSFIVSNTKYYTYSVDHMDIYPLIQRTIYSDKFLGEPITQKVRNIFYRLRTADLDKIFCVSYPKKRWMMFYLPLVDKLGSGYALIFDFQTKSFIIRKVPQTVTIAFNYNANVYIGTEDGKVLKEFTGRTFNGEPIVAYYKSPWFDWADGYIQSFSEFAIEIANEYNNDFYIRTFKDGSSLYEDRHITSDMLTGYSVIWDGIEGQDLPDNDTVWDDDDWVEGTFNHIRMLLPNNVFDKFQLEIGTGELGQAFAIYGYGFRRIETDEAPW